MKPILDPSAALRELRGLVATYLEGSDDASRAVELLDALDPQAPVAAAAAVESSTEDQEKKHQRAMFGCTTAAIDEALVDKSRRDVAMYAMSVLSDAQELIQLIIVLAAERFAWDETARHASTTRQLINVAKYAIDKAVPR